MNDFTIIPGGVCAAKGFKASGVHCGMRKNKTKKDLALIACDVVCDAACVSTRNKVCASPVVITRKHLENHKAQIVIANSGNANACNKDGEQKAVAMCELIAKELGADPHDVIVASTGVIGEPLPLEPIESHVGQLVAELSETGSDEAALAIMTTDLNPKEIAVSFTAGGKECKIGGIAKGSGMIHPNMGTMLAFVTTDVNISGDMLQQAISLVTDETFNMVTVDGDTSTNDILTIMASGLAGNDRIEGPSVDYNNFVRAFSVVCQYLAREIARDGEGATKLIEVVVANAPSDHAARTIAKSVAGSSLLKAAISAADANWGRILCAIGYADADFSIDSVKVSMSSPAGLVVVYENGGGVGIDEDYALVVLSENEIRIDIDLQDGLFGATAWGCDLTCEYVNINASYRS